MTGRTLPPDEHPTMGIVSTPKRTRRFIHPLGAHSKVVQNMHSIFQGRRLPYKTVQGHERQLVVRNRTHADGPATFGPRRREPSSPRPRLASPGLGQETRNKRFVNRTPFQSPSARPVGTGPTEGKVRIEIGTFVKDLSRRTDKLPSLSWACTSIERSSSVRSLPDRP